MTGPSTSTKKCGRELAVFSSSTVATKGIELSPPSRYSCGKSYPEKCRISRMAHCNDVCRGLHSRYPCWRRLQYGSEQKSPSCEHCKNLWILTGSMESRINGKTGADPGMLFTARHRWQKSGTKVREALAFILSQGWHKFKMPTTPEGAKKECCHHL